MSNTEEENSYKPEQKLVSFAYDPKELQKIHEQMQEGWSIVSLVRNSNYFVGIMEKQDEFHKAMKDKGSVFIPPRQKIKIIPKD